MPVRRFSLILLLLLVGLALPHGPTRVAAQDPTPPIEGDVPGAVDCTVTPVTADEMVALLLAAADGAPPDASTPVPVDAALLAPADSETAAAVAATVRQIVGCLNAGDIGRFLALVSDDLVRTFLPEAVEDTEGFRAEIESNLLATPEPLPADEQVRLISVDVSQLPDGRVVAAIVADPADAVDDEYWWFVEEDGRWVLNASLAAVGPEDAGPSATASPGQGTLADPVPLGAAAPVGNWSVWVAAVDADAAAALTAYNSTNPTPEAGTRFVMITLGTSYVETGWSDPYFELSWSAIGPSGTTYVEHLDACNAELPDDLSDVGYLDTDVIGGGTICFAVQSDDAEGLVLGVAPGQDDEQTLYFALR